MEINLVMLIIGIALIQLIGLIAYIANSNRSTNSQFGDLSDQISKQSASIAQLSGLASGNNHSIVSLVENINDRQDVFLQLTETVSAQQKSIESLEKRVVESEKVGDLFKSFFDEMPMAIDKYNSLMDQIHNEASAELQKARVNKDSELIHYQEKELEGINVRKKLIGELPDLLSCLNESITPVNERLKLFSGREKYPTGNILSYPSRRAKQLLTTIGEQSTNTIANRKKEVIIVKQSTKNGKNEKVSVQN